MGSTKTDEALEAICTAFAGVFWGRARSQDGSEEVDGVSLIYIVESSIFYFFQSVPFERKKKKSICVVREKLERVAR